MTTYTAVIAAPIARFCSFRALSCGLGNMGGVARVATPARIHLGDDALRYISGETHGLLLR